MATSKRKPLSTATRKTDSARAAHPRIGQRQVVLVLQGGGALGAYQAGVYEALHEAGIEPDWVIGTSIGAINAALIVGNRPEDRLKRLREFWHTVAHKGLAALWPGPPGSPTFWTTLQSVSQGLPGFFTPNRRAWLGQSVPLDEDDTGYYHTTALRDTLEALTNPDLLNSGAQRLTLGAVNVHTGAMRYFDSRAEPIALQHVLASGALPPAFPPVRIGDDLFWDGGIYSNTPVEAVFDDKPRRNSLIFSVQLWRPQGEAPQSMRQVSGRQKDITFASRVDSHVQRQAQIHRLRHIVRELARELPARTLARADIAEMVDHGCGTVMHVMRLIVPPLPDEDHTKDMDFNSARIAARWSAGLEDARRAIAQGVWLAPVEDTEGLVLHDLDRTPTSQALQG